MPKRGLFKTIFGKDKTVQTATQYTLLNTNQTFFVPFSGNAYDINTVRASVDAFARRAAKVKPRHIRRSEVDFINVSKSKYNRLLQFRPNPYTSAYKFYYRIATQYKIYNNAFIYPLWNTVTGELEALYNVNATSIELVSVGGEMCCKMRFASGNVYTCRYADLIHISRHNNNNDVFGENNMPISPVLQTADTFNQSMGKLAELVAVVRGILKVASTTKAEDLNRRRDEFIRDNLKLENNGAGVIVTDNKYEYTPINDKQTPIPTGQLDYVKGEIYDYFGVNEAIVQSKETPEQASAFYNGEIAPFYEQLSQAFTNGLFSGREFGHGNEIIFEGNSLQNEKLSDKTAALKFLADIGAITVDNVLLAYNMSPLGGAEGARRVQTLNMVNADRVDEYQLGDSSATGQDSEEETEE